MFVCSELGENEKFSSSLRFQLNFHNHSSVEERELLRLSRRMRTVKLGETFVLIKKLREERKNF